MAKGSIFTNNRSQAVRLPAEARFPDSVKKVAVRIKGQDRILSPADKTWDGFFLSEEQMTDDFMNERASQEQTPREEF